MKNLSLAHSTSCTWKIKTYIWDELGDDLTIDYITHIPQYRGLSVGNVVFMWATAQNYQEYHAQFTLLATSYCFAWPLAKQHPSDACFKWISIPTGERSSALCACSVSLSVTTWAVCDYLKVYDQHSVDTPWKMYPLFPSSLHETYFSCWLWTAMSNTARYTSKLSEIVPAASSSYISLMFWCPSII